MNIEDMINIRKINIIDSIEDTIKVTNNTLSKLDKYRTCKIYTSFIHDELVKRNVVNHIVYTSDLGYSYGHEFVLVPYQGTYILIDLTYGQYNREFPELLAKGYVVLDEDKWNYYMATFGDELLLPKMDYVFGAEVKGNERSK